MIDGPGFARRLFVAAEREKDDVGFRGDFGGFVDAFGVERGIAEDDFVGVPIGIRLGDFACRGNRELPRTMPTLVLMAWRKLTPRPG